MKTTPEELLLQVIDQTMKAYSVDEKLTALTVMNTVSETELKKLT